MKLPRRALYAFVTLFTVRFLGMALIPLNETTEARYGEIARKMLATGDWVTLWHDYGVPFWAKPPLYAWLSAASMGLFGVHDWAARLPSLLVSCGVVWLTGAFAARRMGSNAGVAAALVLAGSAGFFVAAGTVMTDLALLFCITLILISFWESLHGPEKGVWPWLFFTGCGFGLLAKGPVALVLAGLPVFFWVLMRREWLALWQKLPWIRGSFLTLAIALPWYALAEHRTPGFLSYFIIGENISRFLDPGWKGDRYGFAHAYPYGMIWLFVAGSVFPWYFAPLTGLRQHLTGADKNGLRLFLMLWSITSPAFFTFAANIIWPYALIMLPGFALLLAQMVAPQEKDVNRMALISCLTALAGLAAAVFVSVFPVYLTSQKDVIVAWRASNPADDGAFVFWSNRAEFSASFYSNGRSRTTEDPAALEKLLHNEIRDCLVTYDYNQKMLPKKLLASFKEVGRYKNARGVRILLCEP